MSVKASDKQGSLILRGADKLSKKGLAPSPRNTNSNSLTTQAVNVLAAVGISVDSTPGDSSDLIGSQTDTETIANPNLPSPTNNSKKQTLATDKFPCSEDSFYHLDDSPSQMAQKKNKDIKQKQEPSAPVEMLAAEVVSVNLDGVTLDGTSLSTSSLPSLVVFG